MNELRSRIISELKRCGADLVRCGAADRIPDPAVKLLMPEARSVICVAFRQLRGSRRGVEDGTVYYQYTTGVETLEEVMIPGALLRGCSVLEEAGFEALPQRRTLLVRNDSEGTNFEVDYAEVYRGKTAEHMLDFERCAAACGLGEIGLSGSVLTDEFGPNQRWGFILTDAELPEDPVIEPHLCDRCGECRKACPGHALNADGVRNEWQCAVYYKGANRTKNPFMPPNAFADDPERLNVISGAADLSPERAREIIDQINFYPPIKHAFVASMCGRACDTACYVHLEEKGVLTRKFRTKFRKRPVWQLPLEG
ncbi:MAG: 4Fe-4S binding protein [Lentisphaeria bacterium]|nr:4Fe-4S binding protein [Lentisphaeria bacterium]